MRRFKPGDRVIFKVFNEEAEFVSYNNNGTISLKLDNGVKVDTFLNQVDQIKKLHNE